MDSSDILTLTGTPSRLPSPLVCIIRFEHVPRGFGMGGQLLSSLVGGGGIMDWICPPLHSSGKPLMMYLEEALERRWEQWESGFPWWVNMKFSGLNLIQICENSRARCSFHLCAALAFPPGADFFLPWRPYWTESVFPRQGSVWIYDLICVFGTKKLFLGWSLKKWLKTIISSPQPSLEGGKRLEVREVEWGVSWDGHMLESCLSPGIQGKKDKVGIPFEA